MRRHRTVRREGRFAAGLAIALALVCAPARAEKYAFSGYPLDALPSPTVRTVFQDRDGLLWIGTELGVVRYDGTTFESFSKDVDDGVGVVDAITQDGAGRIWAVGFGGVQAITKDGVLRITEAEGLPGQRPAAITPTDDGVLVALGAPSSVARIRLEGTQGKLKIEAIDLGDGATPPAYHSIVRTSDGEVVIGTDDGIRVLSPDGHARSFLKGARVSSLRPTRQHRSVLVGSDTGIASYANGSVEAFGDLVVPKGTRVHSTLEARDGVVYAGTSDGVLHRCVPSPDQPTTKAAATCTVVLKDGPRARIVNLVEDGAGTVWGALRAPAVVRFEPGDTEATVIDAHHGFPFADVLDIFAEQSGIVFVATANGLWRVEGTGVVNFDDDDGLPSSTVWSIARLPSGSGMLLGTQNGVALFDGKRAHALKDENGQALGAGLRFLLENEHTVLTGTETALERLHLEGDRVRVQRIEGLTGRIESFCRGPQNTLFVAGVRGLTMVKDDKAEAIRLPGVTDEDTVDYVACGRDDRLWVGTSRGLFAREPDGAVLRIGKEQGLRDDDVDLLFEAKDGTLWVAYTKNLGASALTIPRSYEGGTPVKARHLTAADGLPANAAYAFAEVTAETPGQGLWIGTSRGLLHVDPKGKLTKYGRPSGLASEDVSYQGLFVDDDGSLWVGTTRGVAHVIPRRLRAPIPPPVHLSSVTLGGERATDGAEVPYDRRDFEARFTALLYQGEGETSFRYRLKGFREDWTPLQKDRAAIFANLSPGAYRFEVEARSGDGIPSEHPAAFSFHVATPFHMTWWFRLAVATLGVGLVYSVVRGRVKRLDSRNRELEIRVAERTAELEERVVDLRKMNERLTASQKRADRIFSALADALPGTVIDEKYRLEERIGAGGAGVVFRAEHLALGRPIAVKIFKPRPGNDSAENLERFRLEGRSAARVEHPNAVQVFDFGISDEGIAYLVMQLLDGHSLADEISSGPFTIDRTIFVVDAVASVLEVAHGLGIVHRDIKPENVFLHQTPDGEVVKVVDFGIAKLVDERDQGTSGLTLEGAIVGTVAYMAPERFDADARLVGPPADVYALGVLLFQLLTGRLPFTGAFGAMVSQHIGSTPPAASSLRPELPKQVDDLLNAALAKDPAERPGPEELAMRLRRAFGRSLSSATAGLAPTEGRPRGIA